MNTRMFRYAHTQTIMHICLSTRYIYIYIYLYLYGRYALISMCMYVSVMNVYRASHHFNRPALRVCIIYMLALGGIYWCFSISSLLSLISISGSYEPLVSLVLPFFPLVHYNGKVIGSRNSFLNDDNHCWACSWNSRNSLITIVYKCRVVNDIKFYQQQQLLHKGK